MGQVVVTINGRSYTVACDDGEEEHLSKLAEYVDRHVSDLSGEVGQVGDARLLLMAGLVIADELSDALGRVTVLDKRLKELEAAQSDLQKRNAELEEAAVQTIDTAAKRLEDIAERISAA